MQKRDIWLTIWVLVVVIGVFLLGVTLFVAVYFRERGTFANVASIWGLFVGLIGFVMTLYTLFETQRTSRKAQEEIQAATAQAQEQIQRAAREAQEAVRWAQEETRQILERVRHSVRDGDFATLLMWVKDLRTAAGMGNWPRALFLGVCLNILAPRQGIDHLLSYEWSIRR